jgi:hypothetical protein
MLNRLKEAINNLARAIRNRQKTKEQNGEGPPGTVAVVVGAPHDDAQHARTYREKGHSVQKVVAVATIGAFISASIYAYLAWRQVSVMNKTYGEMQDQTRAAKWTEYYSCLNSRAVQDAANQSRLAAIDSHVTAVASVQQVAAAIEPQRAHVMFKLATPNLADASTSVLTVPYSVENYGKSATPGIAFKVKAILLKRGENLLLNEDDETAYTIGPLQSGGVYPEAAPPPYRAPTPFIYVVDRSGQRVDKSAPAVLEFVTGNGGRIAVIAQLVYSDFAGAHHDRFCRMVNVLRAGGIDEGNRDANVIACNKYSHEDDAYSQITLPSFPPPGRMAPSDLTCVVPKD